MVANGGSSLAQGAFCTETTELIYVTRNDFEEVCLQLTRKLAVVFEGWEVGGWV
jgi:hypothetical protein